MEPLGTVVPLVRYSVMDQEAMRWRTVLTGPETPLSERNARRAAAPGAFLWVREPGEAPRPLG